MKPENAEEVQKISFLQRVLIYANFFSLFVVAFYTGSIYRQVVDLVELHKKIPQEIIYKDYEAIREKTEHNGLRLDRIESDLYFKKRPTAFHSETPDQRASDGTRK